MTPNSLSCSPVLWPCARSGPVSTANHLQTQFAAGESNRVRIMEITYIRTHAGLSQDQGDLLPRYTFHAVFSRCRLFSFGQGIESGIKLLP